MNVGGASSASRDYWLYTYDALGQVISGKRYWSDGTPVAGQQFEYGFDDIGNRRVARRGGDENGWNLRESLYTPDLLNQYTNRTVPGFADVVGVALATKPVYVNGQMASRKGEYFGRELSVNNAGSPVWLGVTVTSPGEPTVTGNLFVPRTPEVFTHDLDGNLTTDGRSNYTWDAENRLLQVESRSDVPSLARRKVEWQYDALGRRVRQTTWNWLVQSNLWVVTEDLKFVSDPLLYGRHVVDLNASNNVPVRTYVWGLDLSETLDGAGGVGGLLWVTMHTGSGSTAGTHFCAYDGNGNIVALSAASDGSVNVRYEYGPFAEPIRLTGPAAALNPFRFSTKRTCNTTDLVLYEYRAYSPSLGRWLSRDPIQEKGGWNLYGFVSSSPLINFDVLGLSMGKGKEAIGKNGEPRIIFEPPSPRGGWRGKLGFDDIQGSSHSRAIHEIYVESEAAVAVLCICPQGCEIRRGTRITKDQEYGNWLAYDPTSLPQTPHPVPQHLLEVLGRFLGELMLRFLGPALIPQNEAVLESMKATTIVLVNRRPQHPWEGYWKGGMSPCGK